MMDIGEKYSHMGSYYLPDNITESTWKGDYIASDLCPGFESYSTSSSNSTSWASAIVHAAEYAFSKAGYEERFSLKYVLKCLPEFSEAQPNEIRTSDIISFIAENGLMTDRVASSLSEDDLCSSTANNYKFDVIRNDVPNESGLKNFANEGNPVIVLLALDLLRLQTVNNVTGTDIYRGATDEPSVYGILEGYEEDKWTVGLNVVPCEYIVLNLPVTNNDTNANYAGIAGYAFSLVLESNPSVAPVTEAPTEVPTTEAPTTEAPTTEVPTTQTPTTESPTTEAPTTEVPTTEAPTTEVPTTEVPTTEVPTTEVPTTEVPTTEAPTTEVPSTEAPTTEVPTTQTPSTEAPTTEAPTTEVPTTEVPTTEAPTTEVPTTQAPTTEAPTTEAPTTVIPSTVIPSTEAPTTEAPTTEEPASVTPITEEPKPTSTPAPLAPLPPCTEGHVAYRIVREYGANPSSSEKIAFNYGIESDALLSTTYNGKATEIVTGCMKPQLMNIVIEGSGSGWNDDSYFTIESEFGVSDRITLRGSALTTLYFHNSYGLISFTEVTSCDSFTSLPETVNMIIVTNSACNRASIVEFSTARFPNLVYLWIEDENFMYVRTFNVQNNPKLQYLYIQSNSFTQKRNGYGKDSSKSFRIVNCESLVSIEIDRYSFSDFGGAFELKNLPQLQSIQIGTIGSDSNNFYGSSLEIGGIDLTLMRD